MGPGSARYEAQEACVSFGNDPICEDQYTRVALVRLTASCNEVNDTLRLRLQSLFQDILKRYIEARLPINGIHLRQLDMAVNIAGNVC